MLCRKVYTKTTYKGNSSDDEFSTLKTTVVVDRLTGQFYEVYCDDHSNGDKQWQTRGIKPIPQLKKEDLQDILKNDPEVKPAQKGEDIEIHLWSYTRQQIVSNPDVPEKDFSAFLQKWELESQQQAIRMHASWGDDR